MDINEAVTAHKRASMKRTTLRWVGEYNDTLNQTTMSDDEYLSGLIAYIKDVMGDDPEHSVIGRFTTSNKCELALDYCGDNLTIEIEFK